ncbi:MAG: YjgP/YjgQ family permease [Gemmatimonadetes bacterium]|nr:YjgP/YjgQ family permease [Gemmatimonadota bacterium]MBT5060304.1 YjgP/YjgQ family permease [Gemmatimonadota bacterium]MBT5588149.1 YjgP/YjgQ family permease [Gemmatimonadota bacterium]MBT5960685.1 YjgP/YjgQ family permease [Gemmatimonadota bacterium]MBT6629763.1 YjgP/YjgQ family permease [Gemmatimonadota bacterium]
MAPASMMHLLDRYVLRRHLYSLALSGIALWSIAIVVDLIENIDTFIDHEAELSQIVRYYVYRSPYWIVLTLPITTLLGTLFSLTGLARRSEITAAKAAGISLHRLLAPLYLFALLFAGAAYLFTDVIVPPATFRYNSTRDEIRSYRRADGSRRQVLLQDVKGQFIFARSYDHTRRRAHDVTWERTDGQQTLERAVGRQLQWRSSAAGERWWLVDGHYHSLDGDHAVTTPFDSLVLSQLTLLPADLARQQRQPEEMNYAQLEKYIERARSNGEDVTRHLVDLNLKVSFPFTCVVIFCLGAPLAANARRSGRANAFGLGVLICFVFYSCVKAGQALGWNGVLGPWLGAWLANVVFGLLSIIYLRRTHT